MSYEVILVRKEVKENQTAEDFGELLENEERILPFTQEQRAHLKNAMQARGYKIVLDTPEETEFEYEEETASALLTRHALYLEASGDGAFEISLAASELADTDEFAKYDPQNGGWEEAQE
ncbi:MAG: hypothetical protein LBP52_06340 [Burkholderiaceae bacterium]|jgi:hypothetical protein|nr:hypothetical protein [Burkholderiaceae bacterium]